MQSEFQLRRELAQWSQRMWHQGFVANHDGNLSIRLPRGRYLCTPSGRSKAGLTSEEMLLVDESGRVMSGKGKIFSEFALHVACYQARPKVMAVVHAHPVTATGFGVAGIGLDEPMLPEAVVSLGPSVPLVPLALPAEAASVFAPFIDVAHAWMLSGNGVLCVGESLEQAYLRLELVEHLCKIALVARQLGAAPRLPTHFLPPLMDARKKAGLCAPADVADSSGSGQKFSQQQLDQAVSAALKRVLGPQTAIPQ